MKQCAQRYEELRYSRNHRRYNQSQKIYDAQFITADCTKVCWGVSAFAATLYPGLLPTPGSPAKKLRALIESLGVRLL